MNTAIKTGRRIQAGVIACAAGLLGLSFGACGADDQGDSDALQYVDCDPSIDGGIDSLDGGPTSPDGGDEVDGGIDVDAGPDVEVDGGGGEQEEEVIPPAELPEGASFGDVTANGTGCPRGTWEVKWSEDKSRFKVVFSAFEATVGEEATIDVKNCQLGISLNNPEGTQVSVSEFAFQGEAFLERDVSARITSNYYFQGNPARAETARLDLTGPYDDTFLFRDTVSGSERIWSPCGLDRSLQVNTTVRLQGGPSRGAGHVKIPSLPGTSTVAEFKLDWRTCN